MKKQTTPYRGRITRVDEGLWSEVHNWPKYRLYHAVDLYLAWRCYTGDKRDE